MTTFQRLKHEARKAEQRSDWRKAIALYREAMRFDEHQRGSTELGLYNRIGDLHIRLGEVPQAVEYYEQAADRYAEHELPTSAIALCNKILRVAPERTDVFRRLGLLHAATGLLAEARAATLQYVDRMEKSGSVGEAIDAVQEFVNQTGDESLRVQVADLLTDRGCRDQALAQLRLASAAGRRKGLDTAEIEQRIDSLSVPGETAIPGPEAGDGATPAEPDIQEREQDPGLEEEPSAPVRLGERVSTALAELDPAQPPFEAGQEMTREEAAASDSVPGPVPTGQVADALQRFRARVQPELDRAGAELHYDLGVAFQGMGLRTAAVEELRRGIGAAGRLHAAHERITEMLEKESSVAPEEPPATEEPLTPDEQPAPEEPLTPVAAVDESAHEPETVHGESQDGNSLNPDLQGQLFRARLAQYQIRRAQDSGRTDHRSHLDLGAAYSGMGLREEAIRELLEAAAGPGHVASRAASMLLEISRDPETQWELALSVLERIREMGRVDSVEPVLHELMGRWTEDHPGTNRVGELLGWVVTSAAPEAESGPSGPPEVEDRPEREVQPEPEPRPEPADEPGIAESESLEALDQLLDQLEGDASGVVKPATAQRSDPSRVRDEAEKLLAEDRQQEAITQLFRALEMHEDAREIREATAVVDRLLELRPDDVVLHHQRAEFALTLDDRAMLLSSYMNLAECLRRQNSPGNARTVYGRILDIDPEHPGAREALNQLSTDQYVRRAPEIDLDLGPDLTDSAATDPGRSPSKSSEGPSEFDALLQDLRDPGPGDDAFDGDAEAHFELGIAFKQMGMWDEALVELQKAVSGLQDPAQVWEVMAECLEQAGRPEEAVDVLYRLAVLLQERGDQPGAAQRFRRVVDMDATFRDAASRLSALSR